METIQPKYVPISTLHKIWIRNKTYIYRRIDLICKEGKFNDICLQLEPQQTMVHIDKFENWMKGQHMKWLKRLKYEKCNYNSTMVLRGVSTRIILRN